VPEGEPILQALTQPRAVTRQVWRVGEAGWASRAWSYEVVLRRIRRPAMPGERLVSYARPTPDFRHRRSALRSLEDSMNVRTVRAKVTGRAAAGDALQDHAPGVACAARRAPGRYRFLKLSPYKLAPAHPRALKRLLRCARARRSVSARLLRPARSTRNTGAPHLLVDSLLRPRSASALGQYRPDPIMECGRGDLLHATAFASPLPRPAR